MPEETITAEEWGSPALAGAASAPSPDPQRFEIPDFLNLKLVIFTLKVPEMATFRVNKSGISNR